MRIRTVAAGVWVSALFVSIVFHAAIVAAQEPVAYVLDTGAKTVTALDPASAKLLGSVPVEGEPGRLLRTPNGGRLVVLDRGPGKDTVRFGRHPSGKSAVTLIDPASMSAPTRLELGWGLGPAFTTPDSRYLIVLCPGYQSQKPEEALARELVTVDLVSNQIAGRLTLDRRVDQVLLTRRGDMVLGLSPREEFKKPAKIEPGRLTFIDIATPRIVATLKLDGAPTIATLSPDGDYVYLLDVGQPSKKANKNINGRLQVVALSSQTVERTIDAGSMPRGLVVDEDDQQVLMLSDGPASKERNQPTGELRVIRGPDLALTVNVVTQPHFVRVSPDRRQLYVVGSKAITALDYDSFGVAGQVPVDTEKGYPVSELAITPDGTRAFAIYPASSKLLVLDLESRKLVASVSTGRGGVKFGKFMAAVALTTASAAAGAGLAASVGSPIYTYNVFTVAPASTTLVLRPDGEFAYVLNSQTNDVTVVKRDGTVVDKLGGGGRRLQLLAGGGVVTVVGSELRLIDTAEHKALPELTLGGSLIDFALTPDRRHGLALVENAVVSLNGTTGEIVGKVDGFIYPALVVFGGTDADEAIVHTSR